MAGAAAIKFSKQALRKEIKLKLAGLSDEEKRRQSSVVAEKLFSSRYWLESRRISLYLNMNDEIKTEGILRAALEANKQCFIPRYIGASMDMLQLYSWEDYLSLPETAWKIKQPPGDDIDREVATDTEGLDLVITPGLGFTRQGHRLGRGKGYYDSFFTSYRNKFGRLPVTVGLAFREQICDSLPTTEHDVQLDSVLFDESNPL